MAGDIHRMSPSVIDKPLRSSLPSNKREGLGNADHRISVESTSSAPEIWFPSKLVSSKDRAL